MAELYYSLTSKKRYFILQPVVIGAVLPSILL